MASIRSTKVDRGQRQAKIRTTDFDNNFSYSKPMAHSHNFHITEGIYRISTQFRCSICCTYTIFERQQHIISNRIHRGGKLIISLLLYQFRGWQGDRTLKPYSYRGIWMQQKEWRFGMSLMRWCNKMEEQRETISPSLDFMDAPLATITLRCELENKYSKQSIK